MIGPTPACGQATRARRTVALAAFESGFHVEFVDLDRPFERRPRRVQRFLRALDAAVDGFVGDIDLDLELSNTGVQPDVGVEGEKPLPERDRGVLEDRTGLIVKRAVAILTAISLKHSVAAVLNHGFSTAARAIDAVTPANLPQQVRGPTLRGEHLDRHHGSSGDAAASPLPAVTSSYR